ncbi:hypothetical protein HYALB_00005097 [Hymenoscyphus albidus]|uniref:FAD dependent oxidoreductase domain-containing protein n=1 Tax=Hymenoscyphus albidus TaxID=595503 RepID=A0A9N9LX18_9HELO|nr:hypothetical protein HYALB_00005097 [Hymenoscyphus albidus]
MDIRAALPVSLPHPHPTTSYWQDPPDALLADYRSPDAGLFTTEDGGREGEVVDTVIVGSGISGARVAWGLLGDGGESGEVRDGERGETGGQERGGMRKRKTVVMLEARQACSGATGRNGAHTKAASYRSFPSNVSLLGVDEALRIARLEYRNILAVHAFAAKYKIECESRVCDTVDVIFDDVQWRQCVEAVGLMKRLFIEEGDAEGIARYELFDKEEARKKYLVKGEDMGQVKGGVRYAAGSINAYRFVCGVLKLCLSRGLELHTHTPVLSLSRRNSIWNIHTPRGIIKAIRVVLATNAYTSSLAPSFQGSIVPLRGQVTAQIPRKGLPPDGLQTTYSFIYANGYEYMVPRPADTRFPGDIVIGGGLVKASDEGVGEFGTVDDSGLNPVISTYLKDSLVGYFGESWGEDCNGEGGRVRCEWTGIMGYTPDGFPFVGRVPGEGNEGLWVSAGFVGHGMVLCWECGGKLVEIMMQESGEGGDEVGDDGGEGFPRAFLVDGGRLRERFRGRLHTGCGDGDGGRV